MTFPRKSAIIYIQAKERAGDFMAKLSDGKLDSKLREDYAKRIVDFFTESGEEVGYIASNAITFPVVDEARNEKWITIRISVPKGERNGEPYDGYAEVADYEFRQKVKADKAKAAKIEKEKKIASDAKIREAKAAAAKK